MTEKKELNFQEIEDKCEECKKIDESVRENLILTGFKICQSCRILKTIFPIQLIVLIGNAFIRLITKEADKNAIIKNAKKIIPNDLRLDLKPKTCLVDMINDANIQN